MEDKGFFEFLSELNKDRRVGRIVFIIIMFLLIGAIIGCILGMFFMSIHCQDKIEAQADRSEQRMYEFISQYDFSTAYNLDTGTIIDSDTSGNINFNQR